MWNPYKVELEHLQLRWHHNGKVTFDERLKPGRSKFNMAAVAGKSDYGDVIISLENCILSEEQLEKTPSIKDGLDKEVEIDLRIVGCEYIQMAGILLKLPQVGPLSNLQWLSKLALIFEFWAERVCFGTFR